MTSALSSKAAPLLLPLLLAVGCGSVPNRDPSGEPFPAVRAESLRGERVALPGAFAGAPCILLVGYVQETQFDLDRWLFGLLQAEVKIPVREVPTIEGWLPGLFAGWIDSGMRSGIPEEDWGSVLTVYDDAEAIVQLTGNEAPRNGRVLLLDASGRIRFFHDRGFSAGKLLELTRVLAQLQSEAGEDVGPVSRPGPRAPMLSWRAPSR
jgi:hypothetical protein